jgi:hypothetical protein
MNRRKGQNGTVVISGSWYRVRWRLDVEGQEKRIHMNEKVAPVVFDRNGNPKPPSMDVLRRARDIVEKSGQIRKNILTVSCSVISPSEIRRRITLLG